jgi:hypothetical protein
MISAIEWIPEGVADPNPKKYEFSTAELELIEMMEQQHFGGEKEQSESSKKKKTNDKKSNETKLPQLDPSSLPADLRMDEYSSDEDENDAAQGSAIGRLLVDNSEPLEEETSLKDKDQDMDSDSDESDDLNDVPDTREYEPIDLEGLNALGISQVGTNAPAYMNGLEDEEDDASDIEDVQIQPGDAIIVVAKTEEVGSCIASSILSVSNCVGSLIYFILIMSSFQHY